MRRPVLVAAVAGVSLAVGGAAPVQAPDPVATATCEGLDVCIPVKGPWVIVPAPARGASSTVVEWQMVCPEGIVGGLIAQAADQWISVSFLGRLGSPINPGVTAAREVTFRALASGPVRRSTSFRPVIGCIPSSGQRTPTGSAAPAQPRPGMSIVRRVRILKITGLRERVRATHRCKAGERLIDSSTAVGIYTARFPNAAERRAVRLIRSERKGRIRVTVVRRGVPSSVLVEAQIHAICAGATRP